MGSSESKIKSRVNTAAIQDDILSNPVMMYSKSGCGFCVKAKQILKDNDVQYKECDLDVIRREKGDEFEPYVNGLVYTSRITSVPQIFICGKFIGGYTELAKIAESKELLKRIEECTGENAKILD